eukprot:COSAG01_NODE_2256_length_8067_cov_5.797691_7_plen_59_part_00
MAQIEAERAERAREADAARSVCARVACVCAHGRPHSLCRSLPLSALPGHCEVDGLHFS